MRRYVIRRDRSGTRGGASGGRALGDLVLDGPQGGLSPAGEAELAEDVRHVRSSGSLRDEELRPDLLVAHALPEQPEDVSFAIGQRLDQVVRGRLLRPESLGEESRDGRIEVDLARVGGPDCRSDLL